MPAHHINIVLRINSFSGVLGQAAAVLMQAGLNYGRHQLQDEGDGKTKLLILETEGSKVPNEVLQEKLPTISGVVEIVSITSQPKEDSRLIRKYGKLDVEENELVEELLQVWPAIVSPLQVYEDACSRKEREAKVTRIGVYVGMRKAINFPELHTLSNVADALRDIVIPALKKVAECEQDGDDLKVTMSVFSRRFTNSMDLLFSQENDKCYFLIGFIEGLLNEGSQLPDLSITEPKCKAIGDPFCLFKVNLD